MWKNYPPYPVAPYPQMYPNYYPHTGMAHPGYYAQPYYYKSGFYGGPYTGELRDPGYYPPGYRHVSPVHRQSKLDTLDPYGKVYLKQKEWKLSTGFNTS